MYWSGSSHTNLSFKEHKAAALWPCHMIALVAASLGYILTRHITITSGHLYLSNALNSPPPPSPPANTLQLNETSVQEYRTYLRWSSHKLRERAWLGVKTLKPYGGHSSNHTYMLQSGHICRLYSADCLDLSRIYQIKFWTKYSLHMWWICGKYVVNMSEYAGESFKIH